MHSLGRQNIYLCHVIRKVMFLIIIIRNKGKGKVLYDESLLLFNILHFQSNALFKWKLVGIAVRDTVK